jgi:single-strand selective monofunctional uracil DNA glycosylase
MRYLQLYGRGRREVLLLGMNPGPWGMAQTGVPFGEVNLVRNWLGIHEHVDRPAKEHPKRPIRGFECPRSEVSGARLWGWARDTFKTPTRFFTRFFIANYCPLCFMDSDGRNITPDKLPARQRKPLLAACDRALHRTVEHFRPRFVIGIGRFAETRALAALDGMNVTIGRILHPSPASPRANKNWAATATAELRSIGVSLPG